MTREATFSGSRTSVAPARRFAEGALEGVPAAVAIDIVLMVSELASNAVVHAATAFRLRIERTDELIRVELRDDSPAPPRMYRPSEDELHGRGLQLVDALSDDWGTRRVDGPGKVVWFVRTIAALESGDRRGHRRIPRGAADGTPDGRPAEPQRDAADSSAVKGTSRLVAVIPN